MPRFLGFDHLDVRVRSLAAVEGFYDALMPLLNLPLKTVSHVDAAGNWHEADDDERPYNVVEYYETGVPGVASHFVGFIEDPGMHPVSTRIAFRVESAAALVAWETTLRDMGARNIETSDEMEDYPAIFFEDPAGTRLELCARVPKP